MLALERIGLATLNLQGEEGSQTGNLFLHGLQTHHAVELLQALRAVDSLGLLVRNILGLDGHQLLVGHSRDIALLQSAGLTLAYLVKELAHSTTVGEVLLARVVHLLNLLTCQFLGLGREDILLALGKHLHNLIEFVGRIVFQVQEIIEAAAHTGIDAEQVVHLHAVSGSNHHELVAIVLHTLHQRLQGLRTLGITLARGADRCQRVGLVNKEDTAHGLVTQFVDHLRRLALILGYHL